MPTERFYNLPEEKKRSIREAAIEEFIRVPYEKASINKIIQTAGISRGSFYTYFEDKRDLLGYIFEDAGCRMQVKWLEYARENNGDIWKTSEDFLDYSIVFTRGTMFQLMKNLFMFQNFQEIFGKECQLHEYHENQMVFMLEAIYESVDKRDFRQTELENFRTLISMIFSAIAECMGWYYHHLEDAEKIKKIFREKLEILRYGICKQ